MTETFGRYELIEQIGTGGMAEVYLAKSVGAEGLEKELVIKKILPEYVEDDRFVEMFISEADIAVGLNHPNIVQIYDFGKVDDDYYLAMEYVDGPDLRDLLVACDEADEPLPIGDSVYIAAEVAKGLHYAHRRTDDYGEPLGIVHRDVSPRNILVSREGAVKVVDFGIAKATSAAEPEPEVRKGTYRYMSPEQASGDPLDHRSDLFSLGAVLFEMVCGRPLFEQSTRSETLSLVKSAVVPDISDLNPDVPERLESTLYRVLGREPEERHESARDLQVELTKVLYDLGEIHDSMTLRRHISEVSEQIADADGGAAERATDGTNVLDTVTRPQEEAAEGTDVVEPPPGVLGDERSDAFPPEPTARQRKEGVFIQGEVTGLLRLKSEIDEQHSWIQVLEEYTRIVDSITFKNDGHVHHVDESGFLIVLGIPVSSENDALRGTRVAVDLQEAVSGMNLSLEAPIRLAIGVASGEVLVEEETGEGSQYDWSFFGSSPEYAEQLAEVAMPEETLVSPQIYRRVRRDFECEKVGETRSVDEDDAVAALRLLGPKSPGDRIQEVRRSYHSLYGRGIPLKVLRERFRSTLLDERAQAVVVTGEQGVGKSTLMEEFLAGLDTRDARVIRDVATPADRDVPLGSFGMLFADMMRLGGRGDVRKRRTTLETRIDALFPEVGEEERELLLHSLGTLLDVNDPAGAFADLNPEERRMRIFLSMRRVLRRFAERKPVVFALDDADYLDSVSLEFVTELFEEPRDYPVFCVFTADQTGGRTERSEWKQLLATNHVRIERLDELPDSAAERLIADLLRSHGVDSEQLVEDIYRWSGGNPMFVKETIDLLRDRGRLGEGGESTQVEVIGDRPEWLPSSVEELISAKLDRLDPSRKRVLQRVALLWTPFSAEEAEIVLEERAGEELQELVRQQFLERADVPDGRARMGHEPDEVPVDERAYRFCNAMTREVAGRTLLPEESERLHGTIASYLEDRVDEPGVADRARLARHLAEAGARAAATEYFLEAADDAREKYGASESLRLAGRALELAEKGGREEFEAQRIREQALAWLGENEAVEQVLDRLFELVEEVGDERERVEILLRGARFFADIAEFEQAREYAERARESAEGCDYDIGRAESRYLEAGMLMREGARESALDLTDQAIELYGAGVSSEHRLGLAQCHNIKGVILRRAGEHRRALEAFDEALQHGRVVDNRRLIRFVLNNSGLALVHTGEYSEALRRYERALEHCERVGDRRRIGEFYVNIGHVKYLLGVFEEAVTTIRKGIYRGRQTGVDTDVANGLISVGLCYLEQGDLEAADRSLHEGLRIADSIPEAYFGVHAMFALAKVRLAAGTVDDAETALVQAEDGLDRAVEAGMDWGLAYGHVLKARALHTVGDRDAAIEEAERAVETLDDESGYRPEEVWYYYARILPDESARREERRAAVERARSIVDERRSRIEREEYRQSYSDRPLNRSIRNFANLLADESR